ncbi:MAG TPA: HRDC domain-containing protein [Acidimicrobiales bacterium]|nr:HRDC domain-containing protein [Acidimicrobiales bacterium]
MDTQPAMDELVAEVEKASVYAFDTEFHRERSYFPHLALVQLAWPGGVALVDPYRVDLAGLRRVLVGPGLAVAHAAEQDLEVLELACGVRPRRLFDTQQAAAFLGLSAPSLATLVEYLLGRRLPKGDRLTDWTRRPLSPEQRQYAASDAAYLLDLRQALVRELEGLRRLSWAEAECDLMLARPSRRVAPEEAWWRLKEARQLRGQSRAVAQTVAAWRERRAAATDRPARFILPDLAVVAMAQRPPATMEELASVRGLDGRRAKGAVEAGLLDAVRAGVELDDGALNQPPSDQIERRLRPVATLAGAWLAQRASELRIDGPLLATRADLHALLRGSDESRLASGWRRALVGEPLRQLLAGEGALAVGSHGELVLEARSHQPLGVESDGPT